MRERIVVFDTETGGIDPDRHPLIQWAGVACEDEREVGDLEVKLRFDPAACDPEALELNHYDPDIWEAEALNPKDAVQLIGDFLREHSGVEMVSKRTGRPYRVARLCGHNAVTFDFPFTRALFVQHDAFLPAAFQVLDTLQLALWRFQRAERQPENLKLETLAAYYGVPLGNAHDALADARATAAIMRRMLHGKRAN